MSTYLRFLRSLTKHSNYYNLPRLAPKWSDRGHIRAALRQHLADTKTALGTETEAKEMADLYLISDAYRRGFVDKEQIKERFSKFKKYADGPSLAEETKESSLNNFLQGMDLPPLTKLANKISRDEQDLPEYKQRYLEYVNNHTANVASVFMELLKRDALEEHSYELMTQIMNHDASKYEEPEFTSYAKYFYKGGKNPEEFDKGWEHHKKLNEHHWEYWVNKITGEPEPIPYKVLVELVCDWTAMSMFTAEDKDEYDLKHRPSKWYKDNAKDIILHPDTEKKVKSLLKECDKIYKDFIDNRLEDRGPPPVDGSKKVKKIDKTSSRYGYLIKGGDLQAVGLRKSLHNLMDDHGISGMAVNVADTGNIELTVDSPNERKAREARRLIREKIHGSFDPNIRMVKRTPDTRYKKVALDTDALNRLNLHINLQHIRSELYKPEKAALWPIDKIREALKARYRLESDPEGILRGKVPVRAYRQLKGKEPMYSQFTPDKLIRDHEEALKLQQQHLAETKLGADQTMRTQEEIFEELRPKLPRRSRHASGGFPDARGISDVDISLYHRNHGDLLHKFPEGTTPVHKEGRTLYQIPGYERPVEVYASDNRERLRRAIGHRNIALRLSKEYPGVAERIFQMKQEGTKTEPAIANVLGLEGDPYESVLNTREVIRRARALEAQASAKHSSYSAPYPMEKLPEHLLDCPIHTWRARTGVELIHPEPTKKELNRIIRNWKYMTPEQKAKSDAKSLELFGRDNMTHAQHIKDRLRAASKK